jgi:endogenous inhibitor of DNA gyrase (YacG/DUF329 family)
MENPKCIYCMGKVPITYKGIQRKFCTEKCRYMYKKNLGLLTYQKNSTSHKKKCFICRRLIASVGQKKRISKYCSKKCMVIGTKQRDRNQKHVYVKIPIDMYYKLFTELPTK